MSTLWLRIRAPFAAFRWMQAGVYRATSPVIPPSAAWGLLLNLAGLETRGAPEVGAPATPVSPDAPPLCIAVGLLESSEMAALYQQLHSYPVGASGGEDLKPLAKGAKYWIAPVRREILVDFDCQLGVRATEPALLRRVVDGLVGQLPSARYGLPFAGDNNLLIDRIDVLEAPRAARWYERMAADERPRRGSCRLTIAIDRADASRTTTALFAPTEWLADPPPSAWTWCPRTPAST